MHTLNILFVCLGNTCRSPMAESVMKHLCEEHDLQWRIDSAALRSWNVGRKPDNRCLKILEENGMQCKHYGRLVIPEDFLSFDYIIGMDECNVQELQQMANMVGKNCRAKIELLGSYMENESEENITDPFFSRGMNGFRCAFGQIYRSCQRFIMKRKITGELGFGRPLVQNF